MQPLHGYLISNQTKTMKHPHQHTGNVPSGLISKVQLDMLSMAFAFISLIVASCGPSQEIYNIPPESFSAKTRESLSVGDTIRISFPGAPEYNQSQKIRADGKISLPTVGNITAAGRSVSSLQSSLTGMYEEHLNDPSVVIVLEMPAAAVYVSGQVNTPGKVPLDRSMTALEAIMEAGGFSPLANPNTVYIIRNEGDTQKRYPLNLKETLAGHENRAFYVRPYDVIYVEKSNW